MAQRECSVRLKLEHDVLNRVTTNDVIDHLYETGSFSEGTIKCVQIDKDESVVVTFADQVCVERILGLGTMNINSFPVIVSSVDARRKYVKVYYLPYEVQNSDLQAALAEHGHVYNVRRDVGYKGIEDGVRTVTMNVNGNIPSFMKVGKYECKIWYRGQRQTCRKCYSTEHFARDCPNVQCYRCKEMGHVSRNCLQEEYCDRCGQSGHTEWRCRISHYENARASALEQPVSEVLAEEMVEKEPEKEQEQQKQESKESVAMDDLPFGDTDGEEEQVTSQDGGDIERLKEAEEVTQMEAVQGTAKRQRPPSPLTSPRTKQRKDDKQKEKEDDGEN
ncbi:hypothetical protein QZH41_004251 [Actinostola sp. cb2023]|nr:hypothetical protein QZH41_004251 [Actinostola sp. cb2023]